MEKLTEKQDTRYEALAELGFSLHGVEKIFQTIKYIPEDISKIQSKIDLLKDAGFTNPIFLLEKNPSILTQAEDAILMKIHWIEQRNFSDPIRLFEKAPSIFNYAISSMEHKIARLMGEGFLHPIALLEKMPTIFGLADDPLSKKIKYMEESLSVLGGYSQKDAQKIIVNYIEHLPSLLGMKFDKLVVLIRVITLFKKMDELPTDRELATLAFSNIENILLVLERTKNDQNLTLEQFFKKIKEIQTEDISKSEKQEEIVSSIEELESDDIEHKELLTILKRYKRGYIEA